MLEKTGLNAGIKAISSRAATIEKAGSVADEITSTTIEVARDDFDPVDALILLGGAAAIITGSVVLGPLVLGATLLKTAFDAYEAYDDLSDENERTAKLLQDEETGRLNFFNNLKDIEELLAIADAANCLISVKDYDFPPNEIADARQRVRALGIDVDKEN